MARTPEAAAVLRGDNRKLDGDLAKTRKKFGKLAGGIRRSLSGALSPLGVGLGAAGLGLIGKEVLDFEETLERLRISAGATPEEIERLRDRIDELSDKTGLARENILGAVNELVELQGTAGFSASKMEVLAMAATATGAGMQELAGLAFALGNAFQVTSDADLGKSLSGIIEAGKEGAVPLTKMSNSLQQIAVQFSQFGSKLGPKAATELAAAMQIARRGFGSAEEAATGVQSLMTALIKKADALKKVGVDVFADEAGTEINDLTAILGDLSKLSFKQLTDILGRVEAAKGAQTLVQNMRNIKTATGETLIGYEELLAKALESDAVMADSQAFLESKAGRTKRSFNDLKQALVSAFTPERIAAFVAFMEKLAPLAGFVADHIEVIALTLGGIKLAGLLADMGTMLGLVKGAEAASGGLALGLKNAGAAALLVGSAIAGWKLGGWIDDKLGISDWLSEPAENKGKEDGGFLRDRVKDLGWVRRMQIEQGGATRDDQSNASALVRSAREHGAIREDGSVDSTALFKNAGVGQIEGPMGQVMGANQGELDAAVKAIEFAQQVVKNQQQQKVEVVVSLADDRLEVVEQRRSPQ